jgi:hypothetical protein
MVRLDAFGHSVSEFIKGAWAAAPSLESLQVIFNKENFQALFNRGVQAFSSIIASPPKFSDFQNPRVVVITSVTVVVLFVAKKVAGSASRSGTVVVVLEKGHGFKDLTTAYEPILKADAKKLPYDKFVAKHGEKAIEFLDEPTRDLLCHPSTLVIEEVSNETVVATQPATSSTRANALALQLKRVNGTVRMLIAIFDRETLASVTDLEGKAYISKIIEEGVRNETITYPQLRPLLNLQALEKADPDSSEMQLLRKLFLSFPGRYANSYEEDRRVFKCDMNIYVLWNEVFKERSRDCSTAKS